MVKYWKFVWCRKLSK